MIGIEFTYKDGSVGSYDPLNYPQDFVETDTEYILNMHTQYRIQKSDVETIRHYELCSICGFEIYDDEFQCHEWGCENNLDRDNQLYFNFTNRNITYGKQNDL